MKYVLKNAISVIPTALLVALVWVLFLGQKANHLLREIGIEGDLILFLLIPGLTSYGLSYLVTKRRVLALGAFSLTFPFTIAFLIARYSKYFD